MEKNSKEKQLLYEWAKSNSSSFSYQEIDKLKESYFIQRKEESKAPYMREYGFDTLSELMKELDILWEKDEVMEKIKKAVGVACLKNRMVRQTETDKFGTKKKETSETETLPVYIYNF